MKQFELSSSNSNNGRKKFKAVLYTIFPDSCIDEKNQVGTMYNKNGITWIKEYCEKALPSIKGMSLRCEFTDEERTEILGHGETGIIDGKPVFEDAVVIGTFTNGYIDEIETEDGIKTVCIGEGEIDSQCYHNFIVKLEEDISNGIYPNGSVEIMKTNENKEIIYKYGYKELGRIPTEFIHSGYALLSITPADDSAKLIELNKNKEEKEEMTDLEIKKIIKEAVDEMSACNDKIREIEAKCAKQLQEKNEELKKVTDEKNQELINSKKIQEALDNLKKEYEELDNKWIALDKERKTLEKALGEAKARERIASLDTAIADFTEDEKAYANKEIEEFKKDPNRYEVNSVVNKIWEGIGKNAKSVKKRNTLEINSYVDDIFGEVVEANSSNIEDMNIF